MNQSQKISHVVFIEDDRLDYTVYEKAVKKINPSLHVVQKEAIDQSFFVQFSPENTLVFLDLLIGKSDGLEIFCNSLAAKGYQVYVLSSSDNPRDISRSQLAGVNGYLQKMSGIESVEKQMNSVLGFSEYNFLPGLGGSNSEGVELIQKMGDLQTYSQKLESQISILRNNLLYPEEDQMKAQNSKALDKLFVKIASSYTSGIYIYNLKAQTNEYVNSIYTQITGWTKEDLNQLSKEEFFGLFHPADTPKLVKHMERVKKLKGNSILNLEYRFKHKDNYWLKLLSLDRVFERTESGDVASFIGSFYEVD